MDLILDGRNLGVPAEPAAIPYLAGSYISIGTVGMFLWEMLTNLSNEYHLLLKRRVGFLTFTYYWARTSTAVILIMNAVFFTVPLGRHCSTIAKVVLSALPMFVTAEATLIFYRVRAVYLEQKRVVLVFLVGLLLIAGFSVTIPFAGSGFQTNPTNPYCTASMNVRLAEALVITPLVYSIFVFIAVSYKLMPPKSQTEQTLDQRHTLRDGVKAFWKTRNLPLVSRTFLQDGQIYILIFILTTLISLIPMTVKSIPVIYKFIFLSPHVAIENALNSYLLRSVRATMLQQDRLEIELTPNAEQRAT